MIVPIPNEQEPSGGPEHAILKSPDNLENAFKEVEKLTAAYEKVKLVLEEDYMISRSRARKDYNDEVDKILLKYGIVDRKAEQVWEKDHWVTKYVEK